jgi:WD40 repeat protein/carbon monoxide dehydrogenase subunit G
MAMELEHSFTVPVPPDRAWDFLLDVAKVAPSMPGAVVESIAGDDVAGRLKVKVGPVSLTYKGTARFKDRDRANRSVLVEASGKEMRGAGTASATVRAVLRPENGSGAEADATLVTVYTTLNVTGRPAQFGRGVLAEVASRLIDKFADNLAQQLGDETHRKAKLGTRLLTATPGTRSAGRAVSIGVEQFRDPYERLTFAPELVGELGEALFALGFETTVRAEAKLDSADLGAAIREHLSWADAEGVLIVHVLTHGHAADGDASIYLLGSDGAPHETTDVAHWLTSLSNVSDRPLTLFLLDLCQAGVAARLPWQAQAKGPVRGWVIAASRGDRPAYDGRFTRAVTNVLRALAEGQLDIDSVIRHVPMDTIARAIRREVNRLATAEDAYPQQVTASLIDISTDVPDLPFFPNPAYNDSRRTQLRAELDPGLLPFLDDLDEGLDARHFVERAAGAGPLPEVAWDLIGCFTGRAEELRSLSPWLSGEGDGPLRVVTGSPGVGKSALLGVLVCAAHPLLREQTRPVWGRVAQRPLLLADLAAVHARRRGVAAITQSLSRQLGLAATDIPADLVTAITEMARRPVIVVDAVDEAENGVNLMNGFLLPLAMARRDDGTSAVRLLVGVRPYDEFAPMLEAAQAAGGYVDLDDVPAQVLEDDLHQYVTDLLRAQPRYRRNGAVVGAFAAEVARVLSEQQSEHREWGEFLVAGLYTRHLLTTRPEPPTNPAEAGRLGSRVPRTLPEVLELDLDAHPAGSLLRQVIIVLAHAYGQGMPLTVLTRLAATSEIEPTTEAVQQALQSGRFYLRQSTDTDGSTLYRLFHQGLADYLRNRPLPGILARLLSALGPEDARNWQAAEPYVLRHALQHATDARDAATVLNDAGFLLQLDSAMLLPALTGLLGDVYRVSLDTSTPRRQVNRATLALNAVRAGMTDLADAIATAPGESPLAWRPRWSIGKLDTRTTGLRDSAVIAGGPDGTVRVWDLAIHQPLGEPITGHEGAIAALALGELNGQLIAVTGGQDGTIRVWDLAIHQPLGEPITGHEGAVAALALGDPNGQLIAVTGGQDGTIRVWDLATHQPLGKPIYGDRGPVATVALGELKRQTVAVTGMKDGTIRVWDLATHQPLGKSDWSQGHRGMISALVLGERNGRPVAVTGARAGTIRVWDLATCRVLGDPIPGHRGTVATLALGELKRQTVAVTGGQDGTIRVWDLATHQPLGEPITGHQGAVAALALGDPNGQTVAVTGGQDGTIRVWDLATHQPLGEPITGHKGAVAALALGELKGQTVAVTGGRDGTIRAWNLATHQPLGEPMYGDRGPIYLSIIANPSASDPERADQIRSINAFVRPTSGGDSPVIRSLAVTKITVGTIAVLGGESSIAYVIDIATGRIIHRTSNIEHQVTTAITCSQIAGQAMATLAGNNGNELVLDLHSGEAIKVGNVSPLPFTRRTLHTSDLIVIDGSLIEVTGEMDGAITVRADTSKLKLTEQHVGAVTAVTCMHISDHPMAFTGGHDGMVRVWDLISMRLMAVIDVVSPVFDIAATGDGDLLVGAGGEVTAFRAGGLPEHLG